ncbi:PilW family protein [Halomonas llamarensis]|uniref:Prepilin-type N-terminal cleavage/methylation domain-containing protein n=1 Tax=Halomonas llamarensis TaxID=2945104 RepID=A0ABT0SPE2_9GAMM|nr:prepilin-type N-terminal cleavage/methylation domain-containing protein [Halomonas llamarensis]MCL7929666.1 prepilin-type N-terminal cleavage/methylation domain-containing protein [Halomonas llamarensis]
MFKKRQAGFTLVELMVAMVVGTIIILGAGQLFLTTFQTFQKVDELSRKQEAMVFAANTLVNAYRKGEGDDYTYSISTDGKSCSIFKEGDPVVDGFSPDNPANDQECNYMASEDGNLHKITLRFERESDDNVEELVFHVMDRASAINPGS